MWKGDTARENARQFAQTEMTEMQRVAKKNQSWLVCD